MKKLFAILLCAICICSCSKEDEEGTSIDYAKLIVGQWVYDHPEEGVWETLKFTSSGMFYYSNTNTNIYDFENENVDGRYFIEGNHITGTYKLNGVTPMNLDMTLTHINDLEFTAKFNDSGLSFTYARLLDSETMGRGETITPNYENLLRKIDIIAFSSHNSNVASVDASTGRVTAVSSGRTYIDVITKEGTAVVEIIVEGLLPYDFDKLIGQNKSVIYSTFGSTPTTETEEVMVYQNLTNEIEFVRVGIDSATGNVLNIRIYLKATEVDDEYIEKMTSYLEQLYTVFEKGTTDTYKAYINGDIIENATVGITWDIPNLQITYVSLI